MNVCVLQHSLNSPFPAENTRLYSSRQTSAPKHSLGQNQPRSTSLRNEDPAVELKGEMDNPTTWKCQRRFVNQVLYGSPPDPPYPTLFFDIGSRLLATRLRALWPLCLLFLLRPLRRFEANEFCVHIAGQNVSANAEEENVRFPRHDKWISAHADIFLFV